MGGAVDFIGDAVGGIVDAIGDVAEGIVNVATEVMDVIAENPLLIVVAIAAPELIGLMAAEVGVAAEVLAVVETAEAIETGVAILEATETVTAIASVETVTAATVIEGGATVAEAIDAVTLVNEGATVSSAVTTATSGAVQTSTLTELVSTASETMTSAWETLSTGAQTITQTIGETLLPGVDPSISKIVGQIAVNTATNGGHLDEALLSTGLSFGTGFLGSEIADATGSKLAGSVASNVTNQLVRTGDVNLTNLAGGTLGNLVGSEVADETGSKFAGSVASSLTNSTVRGVDPITGLVNVGVNSAVNNGIDSVLGFSKSSGLDDAVTGEDQSGVAKTGSVASGLSALAENDVNNETTTTGGLTQLAENPSSQIADITTSTGDVTPSTRVDDTVTGTSVIEPDVPSASITQPTGGLNQIVPTTVEEETQPVTQPPLIESVEDIGKVVPKTGETTENVQPSTDKASSGLPSVQATAGSAVASKLTSLLKPQLVSSATKAITGSNPAQKKATATQISASKSSKPPAQVDISKLMAVTKPKPVATKAPISAPLKVDVSKLSPLKNVAGLTSILNNAKKLG